MTKKQAMILADLFYKTKPLVGPCREERIEWNSIRKKVIDDLIPEKYVEAFDRRCPQFPRP